MDALKTAGTVVSLILGASGLWFGVGKDVGANKAVVDVKADVATARAETKAQADALTEFKGAMTATVGELRKTITEEGQKTRAAMKTGGVRSARGQE